MKKMKKGAGLMIPVMMTALFALSACGKQSADNQPVNVNGQESNMDEENTGKVYEVSLSTPSPENNIVSGQIKEFAELVEERTNGQVVITPFFSNVLGNQKDMFTALINNEQELIVDGAITDYYATEYGFLFGPYLIRNTDHLQSIMEGELFEELENELAENNVAIIGKAVRGSRVMYTVDKLESAEDINKLVIRMPDLSSYITAWSTIGASTQVMGGADVYSALSTGVVNACEGPYSQGVSDKYAEVTQYLYPTNHVSEPYFIYASQAWLDSLPEELRQIVIDTAAEVMENVTKVCAEDAENSKQTLIDAGMTFDDSIDFSELFEKMRPVYEEKFEKGEWTGSYDIVMSYYKEK